MRLVVFATIVLLTGCTGGEGDEARVATTLLDGSAARPLPVELEGVDGEAVLTKVTVLPLASLEKEPAATICVERFAELEATGSAVVRVAVSTESVTFEEADGRAVFGCSNNPGPREENRRWCDGAYGAVTGGELLDPRLGILCESADGTPVGFAWVEPDDETRFVAVRQSGFSEVYEVAAGMPVRIATVSGVDTETSSASFDVSEHDADGRLVEEYELEAFVAG
jgi:hypothetical protein